VIELRYSSASVVKQLIPQSELLTDRPWVGIGRLGSVTPVGKNADLSIQEIRFSLSGVDLAIATQLQENVRNRSGQLWLAALDDNGEVIPDPYQLVNALLDYQLLEVSDDGVATISIIARTGFYTLERSLNLAWTPENQQLTFPSDSGLDMIPALVNQTIQWTPA
jgi:hypothetical protein